MKYLITGLGNIGAEYDGTRHNIGFDVLDALAESKDAVWTSGRLGSVSTIKHRGRQLILLKPSTYMNLSGKAVKYWLTEEKIPVERSLAIVDDLNLELGVLRMRAKGSAGGHNGLTNIEQQLGSSAYPRLRFGIGDNFSKGRQVNFVLGKWTSSEKEVLGGLIDHSSKMVLSFAAIGLQRTMSQMNINKVSEK